MRERYEPALKVACAVLAAVLLFELVRVVVRGNPLGHLTIPALLDAISHRGEQLLHLSTRQASLEDVFVRLTGRHLRED